MDKILSLLGFSFLILKWKIRGKEHCFFFYVSISIVIIKTFDRDHRKPDVLRSVVISSTAKNLGYFISICASEITHLTTVQFSV